MTPSLSILEDILKGATMGVVSIENLQLYVDDAAFYDVLNEQLNEYRKVANNAKDLIRKSGHEPIGLGKFPKKASAISVKLNVRYENSTSHFAQMMINGSTMGVDKLCRQIRRFSHKASEEAMSLAYELIKTELNNINSLINYL